MTDEWGGIRANEDPPEVGPFRRAVASVDAMAIFQHAASITILVAHALGLVASPGPINIMNVTCAQMLETRNSAVT